MEICNLDQCTGCGNCALICPVKAIQMKENEKGWIVPWVDETTCMKCNRCKKACHINVYSVQSTGIKEVYAFCTHDQELRMMSSSGAVVPELAKIVFSSEGTVCGAVFNNEMHLHEKLAYNWNEYLHDGYSRSKYVQSENGDVYAQIKDLLHNGRQVMFVGTPCQNAALKTYLGKEHENLLQVDFVCHGVPSPGVFRSYRNFLERKYRSKITHVDFRVKKPSWSLSSTIYTFENGKKYVGNMMDDLYNSCFANNNNNSIRESCYNCRYCCSERAADITVCDYWGKREVKLTKDDEQQGVSVVIGNTTKGLEYIERLKKIMIWRSISYDSVIVANTRLHDSKLSHPDSDNFWKDFLSGKDWPDLRPYCKSYLEGVSKKTAFMMRHGNDLPVRMIRKIYAILRKR